MYFKFGHGEAKALSFCVMTTVPKHLDQLSSPKVNVQTTEPRSRSNTHTQHVTRRSGWYGQTFPTRYYFRILVVSPHFVLLDFKIQNQRVPNIFVHFSISGSPCCHIRNILFCLIQYLSSHCKIPSRLQTNYSAAVVWVSISPSHKKR